MPEDEPDIYLIGENHGVMKHAETEQQVITEVAPDYVMLEGYDQKEHDAIQNYVDSVGNTISVAAMETYAQQEHGIETVADRSSIDEQTAQTPMYELDEDELFAVYESINERLMETTMGDESDEETAAYLEKMGETVYRRIEERLEDPQKQGIRQVLHTIYDLQEQGNDVTVRGADIDKSQYSREQLRNNKDEREQVMADRISDSADDGTVVAIVGGRHTDGVSERLEQAGYDVKEKDLTDEDPGELNLDLLYKASQH
ncbi:MAG: TraB/GumN family protein [Candidatus Nanohaloarchaeota archaeon QJJ-5]|nr:TraB/GumN family protein [Candidatus Nanohaloarchaeota archaeon QJJ-5]